MRGDRGWTGEWSPRQKAALLLGLGERALTAWWGPGLPWQQEGHVVTALGIPLLRQPSGALGTEGCSLGCRPHADPHFPWLQ